MNVTIKEQYNQSSHDMCKKHNAKVDRELFRTCPSKLSKRDLEDLYLVMLDNNLELKRTINNLQENNKLLNTKIHRMTAAQKSIIGKERDCCSTTRAMVQEQRDTIADLKRVNERMSERIRVLNMRLCSAKQFLRRSPSQTIWRGMKAPSASLKNSSVSILNTKESENKQNKHKIEIQYLPVEKEAISTRTVESETSDQDKENSVRECNENKCKTLMEELKQKIVGLEEELKNCHEKYSSRICHLESEMKTLHSEKQQAMAESSLALQQRNQRLSRLAASLNTATAHCNELEAHLLIERCKVSELETRLRAVEISNQMVKTVETKLNIIDESKNSPTKEKSSPSKDVLTSPGHDLSSSYPHDWNESSPRLDVPRPAPRRRLSPSSVVSSEDVGVSKHSDDSGYTDAKTSEIDDKALVKVNEDLIKKIMELQNQLDALRVANAGKTNSDPAANNIDECTTPVEKIGQQDYPQSIEGHCKNKELQKGDNHSKTASPEREGNCQKHSEKTQELNKTNEKLDSHDTAFNNKKIMNENGMQPNTEENIYFTTVETGSKQVNTIFTKQNNLTKSDEPLPVDIPEDKTKEKSSKNIKSSYGKIRDAVNNKLRKANSSQESKSTRNVPLAGKEFTDTKLGSKPDVLKKNGDLSGRRLSNAVHSNAPVDEEQIIQPLGKQTDLPSTPRSPLSECHTYTIQNAGAASRVVSPDNTDHEISSITDLPSEGEGISPRTPLSPGEEKITSTYTQSYTETYTEHTNNMTEAGSLSEGELPIRYASRKPSSEYGVTVVANAETNPVPVAKKMEAALQSIGEELARCRLLLDSRRPREVSYYSSM